MKDDDYIEHLFVASTHDYILFFTTVGKVYRLKVHELPLGSRQSKGRAIVNLLAVPPGRGRARRHRDARTSRRRSTSSSRRKKGIVKKTEFAAYNTPLKADGIIAIKLREDDELDRRAPRRRRRRRPHGLADGPGGPLPRASDVRAMGRDTSGVAGMKLARRRRGDRGRHRRRRRRPARRHRERLRQAHARRRLPGQGPRHDGRQDGAARREARAASPARASSATATR